MNKIKRILGIFAVLTLFLLHSISPVLAEEAIGSSNGSSETIEETVNTANIAEDNSEPLQGGNDAVADGDGADTADIDENGSAEATDNINTDDENNEVMEGNSGSAGDISTEENLIPIDSATTAGSETTADSNNTNDGGSGTTGQSRPEDNSIYIINNDVLDVIVPINISITIDPLEIAGKGQVYSNLYNIKNYGDTDVTLTFTDIKVDFADDTNFQAMAQPFGDNNVSNLKSIYMLLGFNRSDIPSEVITDFSRNEQLAIPLSSPADGTDNNSSFQFDFSGNVNYPPLLSWQDNDVKISMSYKLETIPPVQEVVLPPEEITDQTLEPGQELQEAEGTVPETEAAVPDAGNSETTAVTQNPQPTTDPVNTAPLPGSDSTVSDSPGGDSAGSDSTISDSPGSDSSGSDSTISDSPGGDSTGSDSTTSNSSEGDSSGSGSTTSDSSGGDSSGSGSTTSDSSGGDSSGSGTQASDGSSSNSAESPGSN